MFAAMRKPAPHRCGHFFANMGVWRYLEFEDMLAPFVVLCNNKNFFYEM